jgi:hypothetical protein
VKGRGEYLRRLRGEQFVHEVLVKAMADRHLVQEGLHAALDHLFHPLVVLHPQAVRVEEVAPAHEHGGVPHREVLVRGVHELPHLLLQLREHLLGDIVVAVELAVEGGDGGRAHAVLVVVDEDVVNEAGEAVEGGENGEVRAFHGDEVPRVVLAQPLPE